MGTFTSEYFLFTFNYFPKVFFLFFHKCSVSNSCPSAVRISWGSSLLFLHVSIRESVSPMCFCSGMITTACSASFLFPTMYGKCSSLLSVHCTTHLQDRKTVKAFSCNTGALYRFWESSSQFSVSVVAVASTVKQALQESLVQILQPKRRVDILRDVMEAQSQRRPFVITFCGVNGVGKSTNLAKASFPACHFLFLVLKLM